MLKAKKIHDEEIALLIDYFQGHINSKSGKFMSLLCGAPGVILVQSLLYECTGDIKFKQAIKRNFNLIVKEAEVSDRLSPTFCYGIAGIGWLILQLNQKKLLEINPDSFLNDVDEMLSNSSNFFLKQKNYDLLHGALGIGLYYLKRKNIKEVEKIIMYLSDSCNTLNDEVKWEHCQFHEREPQYDFGLAHGQAGIIYFLGKCYKENILPVYCKQLIYGSIRCHWNNIQDITVVGSYFPSSITFENYSNLKKSSQASRLAWCYGDLGVLHTMLLISIWFDDKALREKVEKMLINLTQRKTFNQTLLNDAEFCHGASGVGYIYLNLYRLTGNKSFKTTADYWKKAIVKREFGQYSFTKKESLGQEDNIISGMSGIALFLVSHCFHNLNSDWDECLFLS